MKPVLFVTHDDALWERWRQLDTQEWLPARGHGLQDIDRWRSQGRMLVVLDSSLSRLPAWNDPAWAQYTNALRVVVASSQPDDSEAVRALAAGAWGYCHAYVAPEALSHILKTVLLGDMWIGRALVQRMLQRLEPQAALSGDWQTHLTEREAEVARRAARGDANQDIADALGITERTVRAHLSSVFEKLQVTDRLKLALRIHGVKL